MPNLWSPSDLYRGDGKNPDKGVLRAPEYTKGELEAIIAQYPKIVQINGRRYWVRSAEGPGVYTCVSVHYNAPSEDAAYDLRANIYLPSKGETEETIILESKGRKADIDEVVKITDGKVCCWQGETNEEPAVFNRTPVLDKHRSYFDKLPDIVRVKIGHFLENRKRTLRELLVEVIGQDLAHEFVAKNSQVDYNQVPELARDQVEDFYDRLRTE